MGYSPCRNVTVAALVAVLVAVCPITTAAKPKWLELRLPAGTRVQPRTLRASADGRFAIYAQGGRAVSALDNILGTPPPAPTYSVLDAKTNKATELASLLPDLKAKMVVRSAEIAPRGHLALVFASGPYGSDGVTYLLDLKTGKAVKFLDYPAVWVGDKVAANGLKAGDTEMSTLSVVDPGTRASRAINLRTIPMTASCDGSVLVVSGDAKDPTARITVMELLKDSLTFKPILVTAKGKVLRVLCEPERMGESPVLSPKGKYVAYQQRPKEGSSKGYSVRIVRTADGKERTIDGWYMVIGVRDDGAVIIRPAAYGKPGEKGEKIVMVDAAGKSRTLAEDTGPCLATADRVFYVTRDKKDPKATLIKSVAIPR